MQSLWMLAAALCFSAMGVCVKLASESYSAAETVFYRGLIGVVVMYLTMRAGRETLRTAHLGMHISRGLIGSTSLALWFASITMLPLATAMTLNNTSPVWLACLVMIGAALTGRRKASPALVVAIVVSFAGVVCLLQPHMDRREMLGGALGLASGLISAFAYLTVRELGKRGESETRVVFYFSVTTTVFGAVWMLFSDVHSLTWSGFLVLGGIGFFATLAQILLTRAYRLGNPLLTANLQYAGIVFSTGWGMLLWNDSLNLLSWAGMALIIISGVVATLGQTRKEPKREASAS